MTPRKTLQSLIQLAAWTRKEGKSRSGGLNEKGRKSYERENPGSDLKAPSKEAGNPRRASFCARMSGMKKKLTSSKTANDPDSRINKSLKAWNCSAREELNTILFAKKGGDYKRHWSQKKTIKKKGKHPEPDKEPDMDSDDKKDVKYSAREELEVIQFGAIPQVEKLLTSIGRRAGSASIAARGPAEDFLGKIGTSYAKVQHPAAFGGGVTMDSFKSDLSRIAKKPGEIGATGDQMYHRKMIAGNINKWRSGSFETPGGDTSFSARDQLNTILFGEEEDFAAYKSKIRAEAEETLKSARAEKWGRDPERVKAAFEAHRPAGTGPDIMAERAAAAKASTGAAKAGIGSRIAGAFEKNPKLRIGAGLGVLAGVAGLGAMALRKKPEQQLSAREALNTILMGAMERAVNKGALSRLDKLAPFPHSQHGITRRDLLKRMMDDGIDATKHSRDRKIAAALLGKGSVVNRAERSGIESFSARDTLSTILMGADPRPRNPLGEFSGTEEGQPNPQHMKITYSGLAAGAAGGAAFQGGSTAMKALIEKLKAVKKK